MIVAQDIHTTTELKNNPELILEKQDFIKKKDVLKDGWGEAYEYSITDDSKKDIKKNSKKYKDFMDKKGKKFEYPWDDQ